MSCTWKKHERYVALVGISTVFLLALHQNAEYISKGSTDIYYRLTLSHEERTLMHGDAVGEQRKEQTASACAALPINFNKRQIKWNFWRREKRPRLFYSQKQRILLCETPKCGSSQWRNALLILDGIVNVTTADELLNITTKSFDMAMNNRFFWRTVESKSGQNHANYILNNYYKIMTVREPLERLVSAYRNKLEKKGNYGYTPRSQRIHQLFSKHPVKDGLASFSEFVDFILSVKDPTTLDVHWKRYTDLCDPCKMKYDYIVKMETIYDDIDYLTTKLEIDRRIFFPESKGEKLRKKWDSKYFLYYNRLTKTKQLAIFEFYKPQYDFFGYEYPEFITKLLDEPNDNKNTSIL